MRIAVVCPNLVGDAVMATPTFRALRQGFPNAQWVGLMRPAVAATLEGSPWWDEVILQRKGDRRGDWALLGQLRKTRIDIGIVLPNSFRSALTLWLAGAKRRIGYARGGRSWLLTDRLSATRDSQGHWAPTPIVHYYLALAHHLGCPTVGILPELHTTPADNSLCNQVSLSLGWKALTDPSDQHPKPLVCLNTGGAFGPAKAWPNEYFGVVARDLAIQDNARVLVLCGPNERDAARTIVRLADHPQVVSLADQPVGIGLSKACIQRCDLLITTDSGPRHFATAFGRPVLTIYGPTHMAWTRTYHPHAWHLAHPVPCGPCQRPVCALGHHRCMRDLHPDRVLSAARRILSPPRQTKNSTPTEIRTAGP